MSDLQYTIAAYVISTVFIWGYALWVWRGFINVNRKAGK